MSEIGAGGQRPGSVRRVAAAFVCVSLAVLALSAVVLSPVLWAEVPFGFVLEVAAHR